MKKILIVEDDPFILDIYVTCFKKEGYHIEVARDGVVALEKARTEYPDVILLDLGLPSMDGWQVLEELRSSPATRNLKVIIISNLNQAPYLTRAANLGVSKFLTKAEHTVDDILKTINEVL